MTSRTKTEGLRRADPPALRLDNTTPGGDPARGIFFPPGHWNSATNPAKAGQDTKKGPSRNAAAPLDGGALPGYSGASATARRLDREDSLKLKLRNLGVAPVARLLRSTPLTQPAGHRRAELSVTGMICAL